MEPKCLFANGMKPLGGVPIPVSSVQPFYYIFMSDEKQETRGSWFGCSKNKGDSRSKAGLHCK